MGNCLKNKINWHQQVLLLILFLVLSNLSWAQKERVRIFHDADYLIGTEKDGKKAQKLVGNVRFKHQDVLMYCDSAYFYSKTNSIDAFGSVRINQGDTVNIYGDKLFYNGNTKEAIITGRVVTLDGEDFILFTDRLIYNRALNTANYYTGGRIESKKDSNTLVSRKGYFDNNNSLFTFKDSVVLTNPEFVMNSDTLRYFTKREFVNFLGSTTITGDSNLIYCENGWYDTRKDQSQYFENAYMIFDKRKLMGDTLFYDRMLGFGEVTGNVEVIDTAENITIGGDYGQVFENRDSAIITSNCLLTQVFDQDSLFMHADTFKVYQSKDGAQNLFAYYGVRIFKSDLQGACDSIAYSVADSTVKMFGTPVLWSDENQLTSDTISILIKSSKIHSIFMDRNAFIISKEDDKRFNQVKGKTITGYFSDSKLSKVYVQGNGQSIYFGKDDDGKYIGVNVAESTDIDLRIEESGIRLITLINEAVSSMHPMGELDPVSELRYSGFKWLIDQRPSSKQSLFIK